jgi:hypothetical protein
MADGPTMTILRGVLIFAWSAGLAAAADRDPAAVIQRVTAKVMATGRRIPNYTCVQTVNRDTYRPIAATLPRACSLLLEQRLHPTPDLVLRPLSTDRLRLEVAIVGRGEIFSWAGASRFEDGGIDNVVRSGPIGTGAFGGFLSVIFKSDVKKFTFERHMSVDGRSLMEYSFQVSQAASHYMVKLHNSWFFTPYSGTVAVDPETDEVVLMTVETGELPPTTGQCRTITTLEFGTVLMDGAPLLLARRVRQRFVFASGEETENTITFANCREYRGESTVTFFAESGTAAGNGTTGAPEPLPPVPSELRFGMELAAPIDATTAAAGDPFSGRLTAALRDGPRIVLAPKGTVVEGRLMRVENFHRPPSTILVFKPEYMKIRGVRIRVAALRDWSTTKKKGMEVVLPRSSEGHAGAFRFPGERVLVKKGFRSQWLTVYAGRQRSVDQDVRVEERD